MSTALFRFLRRVGAVLALPFTIKAQNDRELARLVAEGKLHPADVAILRVACRSGMPLYRHSDGRLRAAPERTS